MMEEEWRDILGYRGIYEISNMGRVRRIRAAQGTRPNRILKPRLNTCGYFFVCLCNCKKREPHTIHELVATAFHGQRPPRYIVHHKDGDITNNNVDNLEWVTRSDNVRRGKRFRNPKFLPPWWLTEFDALQKL